MNPSEKSPPLEPARVTVPAKTSDPSGSQAETNRLNAETIKLVAEANEARARQLRELELAGQWLQRELTAEAGRLKQLENDLRAREAKIGEAEKLLKEGPQARLAAASLFPDSRQAPADVPARKTEAEKAEPQKVEAALRAQILAGQQEAERLRAESAKLVAQLWPAALRGDSWRPWRERLLGRAATEGPAALLLARLYTAAALEKAGRPLALELVRDMGRSVYEAAGEEAERLAQALTQSAAGRFEIKVVRPGDRVDNKFMKCAVGGVVEVRAVLGWAVRDGNGQWQFPAEVS